MEAQSKVAHYSECYAFGDDIHPVTKVLNEQRHLSCWEIHPHTMEMVEDQIEKQEKVLRTIENQHVIYDELLKRGLKLKANPNAPSFLEKEIGKLEAEWKETNEKARGRLTCCKKLTKLGMSTKPRGFRFLNHLMVLKSNTKHIRKCSTPRRRRLMVLFNSLLSKLSSLKTPSKSLLSSPVKISGRSWKRRLKTFKSVLASLRRLKSSSVN